MRRHKLSGSQPAGRHEHCIEVANACHDRAVSSYGLTSGRGLLCPDCTTTLYTRGNPRPISEASSPSSPPPYSPLVNLVMPPRGCLSRSNCTESSCFEPHRNKTKTYMHPGSSDANRGRTSTRTVPVWLATSCRTPSRRALLTPCLPHVCRRRRRRLAAAAPRNIAGPDGSPRESREYPELLRCSDWSVNCITGSYAAPFDFT
ncbi:uncharacterized protein B0I36DRAFT_429326 [Microdochium trichocladiopsis]|uniref:Uncharacterized protein n=1 Tax=Microdochium trichocladiopsis TaxID=1682393 RepID=A0A9P9BQQ3_9PEZI|nr:uncharacterized protein B0I36DRAFT_429326 [Microdochium trichocladiopsis]KAH7035128.1 hypothetical protein B0I36DRAFT_429326 [Microdochium trichocladiopsis]